MFYLIYQEEGMSIRMNIFVVGTENEAGKTFITTGLAVLMQSLGYKSGVYKPFQCGAELKNGFSFAPDLAYVKKFDAFIETACSYLTKYKTVPALSAEMENIKIDTNTIVKDFLMLKEKCELVIAEGDGGIGAPVSSKLFMTDIVKLLKLPVIVVAKPNEDIINKTILTVNQAKNSGLEIRGVIINRYPQGTDNINIRTAPRLIEEYSDAKVLGIVRDIENIQNLTPGTMIDTILNSVDVEKIFGIKIPKLNSGV